jgi:hypothetical protein
MKSAKNEKNNEKPKKTHCRNLFAIEPQLEDEKTKRGRHPSKTES